jgi:peptidoglycan/LPS O-acetylase OafA/YrhL
MIYRREIDGLRAIAVLSVILFHAGFATFSGGFVGVDVFFVISGYLITSIILAEKQSGTFSLANFYKRRAKRILPALFFVLLVCLPFAWLLLFPADLKQFSDSLISVSTFLSNVYFWKNSFYFDTAAELKPLLHTWSLAVEEQYYVLFPLFILVTWKWGTRWMMALLALIGLISLGAAEWGSFNALSLSFYLLPTRAWELLIGVLLGFYLFKKENNESARNRINQLISVIGLLAIAYGVCVFDQQTPFPSLYTLVPTTGAGCIILAADQKTVVGKILGSKPLVGIGLLSYSAYLWHQPLFAFARHASVDEPSQMLLTTLAVVALILAYLTWRFIETPFRQTNVHAKSVFLCSFLGLALFAAVGAALPHLGGPYSKFTEEQEKLYSYISYNFDEKVGKHKCFIDSSDQSYTAFSNKCKKIAKDMPTLFLWGDSHAAALGMGLHSLYKNVVQYTSTNCPPILDISLAGARYCSGINEFAMKEIERLQPNEIILEAYWHSYGSRKILKLDETIAAIHNISPLSRITIVGNVPLWPGSLPIWLLKHHVSLNEDDLYLPLPLYSTLKSLDERLQSIAEKNKANFVSALDVFCRDQKCKTIASHDGTLMPTAFDYGHLTEGGSIILAKKLLADNQALNKTGNTSEQRSVAFSEVKARAAAPPSNQSHGHKGFNF